MKSYEVNLCNKTFHLTPELDLYTQVMGLLGPSRGLAIRFVHTNEDGIVEPFTTLTVCFGEHISIKNAVYVDTNNNPWADQLLTQGFAQATSFTKHSGMCEYPLWILSPELIEEFKAEPKFAKLYKQYERMFNKQRMF